MDDTNGYRSLGGSRIYYSRYILAALALGIEKLLILVKLDKLARRVIEKEIFSQHGTQASVRINVHGRGDEKTISLSMRSPMTMAASPMMSISAGELMSSSTPSHNKKLQKKHNYFRLKFRNISL